jgi:putative RecB family exonuclease
MSPAEPVQLGLEGMPRRLFACTPSRLTTWQDCPRRYRFTYLERPDAVRGQAWAHTTLGAAVHVALARWWAQPLARRTPASARALLERAWPRSGGPPDGFADDAQSARWRDRAGDMVERYVATLDPEDEPVAVERTLHARTDGLALSGRVDRLDRRGDELVVVDYKTGRSPVDAEDARSSLALALYAVAAARTLRGRCTRVELHHLPTGRVAAHDHSPASLDAHVARAEALAEQVTAATEAVERGEQPDPWFPPVTSAACTWCDVRRICPAGQAAAPSRRPWDGLGPELPVPDEAA